MLQDEAGYMIILRCKVELIRSGRGGGYLGFARTSWYGTTHIQITHTKRTSARRRYITGMGYVEGMDCVTSMAMRMQVKQTKKSLQVCLFGERNKHGSQEKDG